MYFRNKLILLCLVVGAGGCIVAYPLDKYDACADKKCVPKSWAKRYGDGAPMRALALAETSAGHTLIAGSFSQTMTLGKTVLHESVDPNEAGFVALLNESGNPIWAADFSDIGAHGSAVQSVVVGYSDTIFAAGFIRDQSAETKTGAIVRYDVSYTDGVPTVSRVNDVLLRDPQGSVDMDTEITAIAMDPEQTDIIYAVGRINKFGALPCLVATEANPGMFLAKFTADLKCQWAKRLAADDATPTAITAHNASKNGIWLTGYFSGLLEGDGMAAFTAVGMSDMFLFNLDPADGAIRPQNTKHQHSSLESTAWIKPTAIETADDEDMGHDVIVVGSVFGPTSLNPDAAQTREVGFASKFGDTGDFKAAKLFSAAGGSTEPVTMTGISRIAVTGGDDRFYLAGTFSGGLKTAALDPSPSTIGTRPFFIVIPDGLTNAMAPVKLHDFNGYEESSTAHRWLVHPGKTGVTVLGEWHDDLDLSIPGKFDKGSLLRTDRSRDGFDVVVGHFDYTAL